MRRIAGRADRIDWFQVLVDLGRFGIPATSVAQQLGIPNSTIWGWKQGAEPKHIDGDQLLGLWIRVTGLAREQAPRVQDANDRMAR